MKNPVPLDENPADVEISQRVEATVKSPDMTLPSAMELIEANRLRLLPEQDFVRGIMASSVTAIACAVLWAIITVTSKYQVGYMALAMGFAVGITNRYFGKGISKKFGYSGAIIAFLGCILGNFFSIVGIISDQSGTSVYEILNHINWLKIPEIMMESSRPMDLLFYAIAIYEGYKFSFRNYIPDEIRVVKS